MKIELYNNKWLHISNSLTPTHTTIIDKPTSKLDNLEILTHPAKSYHTSTELHIETNMIPQSPNTDNILAFSSVDVSSDTIMLPTSVTSLAPRPLQLVANITDSMNTFCLIQYTSGGTMLRC